MGFCHSPVHESFASHQNQQEKEMETTPSFTHPPPLPPTPQKTQLQTQNNSNPETLSFQNMQTSRICSLEICMFRPFPSGNHFCQILRAEAKQILTTSFSLLVLKSMAKWLDQFCGKCQTLRLPLELLLTCLLFEDFQCFHIKLNIVGAKGNQQLSEENLNG